ncbi:MAG: tetratricopeptide repeat protein [Prevotellaceae bacterium]|jgi:tetratricopeptide (TPR) repeat protein|nr:tetratricopeptide repeat protein [Prevotellaceae bacterium]
MIAEKTSIRGKQTYYMKQKLITFSVILLFACAGCFSNKTYTEYFNMGLDYAEQGNYTEAIVCYKKALEINPNEAVAYYYMGIAYVNLGNHAEAIGSYQKALDIDPNYAEAYVNMGYSYGQMGNHTEALFCYRKAAQLGNKDALIWLNEIGDK